MILEIAGDRPELLENVMSDNIVVERVQTSGLLLDGGYQLLERTFEPNVLDSRDVFVDRMSVEAAHYRDYLPCYSIAYFLYGETRLVASFVAADVMWLEQPSDCAILAIGNIATAPCLKELGLVGAGSKVLEAVVNTARKEVTTDLRRLVYVVAEAEDRSLGFWKKRGFLYPSGCNYLQPPLEWNKSGDPIYPEVRETLLLMPTEIDGRTVDMQTLKSIISAIYENWSLRTWRDQLSPEAIQNAERYVMDRVFTQVISTMPSNKIALTSDF